ncbi:hypothetical protein BG004_003743 [Podila humilis]|nr:hypothetical protein BG004_003743 [Podila humilis]
MRLSTAVTLFTVTTLALMTTSPFSGGPTGVTARLTVSERRQIEARNPENPNYCPACIKKAMTNHYPHACPEDLSDYSEDRTAPRPAEMRCVCVAFMNLDWMKTDCALECSFVRDDRAMASFVGPSKIPGCEKYVDLEKNEELELEDLPKRDPNHKPVVYGDDEGEETNEKNQQGENTKPAVAAAQEATAEDIKKETTEKVKVEEAVKADETKNQEESRDYETKDDEESEQAAEETKVEEAKAEDGSHQETKAEEVEPKVVEAKAEEQEEHKKVEEEAVAREDSSKKTKQGKPEEVNVDEAKPEEVNEAKEQRDEL